MEIERAALEEEGAGVMRKPSARWRARLARPADSYGLVLALVVFTYVMVSLERTGAWWGVGIVALEGLTLFFALRTSRARPVWVVLAGVFLVASTALAAIDAAASGTRPHVEALQAAGSLLLLVTPVAIARRISTHTVVTAQTILGAISVYVLIGFSFASVYSVVALLSRGPFFVGVPHASRNDYLFFSYTTLTTVGYGNLVPANNLGQTFAMLEALLGQIYLVIVVARLVSLWGGQRPARARQPPVGER